MTDFGIKIAKEGFSTSELDERNLAFSSKYKSFLVSVSGTVGITATVDAGATHSSITHNLGYVPSYLVYFQHHGFSFYNIMPTGDFFYSVDGKFVDYVTYSDSSKLRLSFNVRTVMGGGSGTQTANFYYVIFVNKIV